MSTGITAKKSEYIEAKKGEINRKTIMLNVIIFLI